MMPAIKYQVTLSEAEKTELEALLKNGKSAAPKQTRTRILLKAATEGVRQLRRTGKILSLETIPAKHRRPYPGGQLLEAELEFEQGCHVYDLKFVGDDEDDEVVREFEYDVRTSELWRLEQKPWR